MSMLMCPVCQILLVAREAALLCPGCKRKYSRDQYGYYSFLVDKSHDPQQLQQDWYCEHQKTYPVRVYREFLKPLILSESGRSMLDVGCGLGTEILEARKDGYDAYGVDLPNMGEYWKGNGNDPDVFFECNAISLPLPAEYFDVVWSFGVIEHIGTSSDTATLTADYMLARQQYINELIRVTRPGGCILVSCPNKSFPIDIHHGPTCGNKFKRLRWYIFNKTKLNFHKTWGKYHLLSYGEIFSLFMGDKYVESVSPIPLGSYFSFNSFKSGYMRHVRPVVEYFIQHLPACLLSSFLNPYVLVMVRKKVAQDK